MLLEMSLRMGSKHVNGDMRELAARRANRQQQRILVQVAYVRIVVSCLVVSVERVGTCPHLESIPYVDPDFPPRVGPGPGWAMALGMRRGQNPHVPHSKL